MDVVLNLIIKKNGLEPPIRKEYIATPIASKNYGRHVVITNLEGL